ncbi:MAG: DNA repair protein RecN [Rikenellaceae bacterium]|jgi:DNA repair protein RecN (Recombination protein N)|nr:DNA repair protein RecN [Rikenellaceae bacterium]
MLRRLTVENYALIDSLDITFSEGLNTITGETGAGKSLLLGALSLLLGAKAEEGVLRDKARPCVVEGEFGTADLGLEPLFETLDLEYADPTILRRVVSPAGKSRAFVNDLPVTLAQLREVGDRLVDIHSQRQTQLLSSPEFQIALVDSVAENLALSGRYGETYNRWRKSLRELEQLRRSAEAIRRDEDYLRFQWQELDEARLRSDEQEEQETLLNELTHAVEIKEALFACDNLLSDDENGILTHLKAISSELLRVAAVFPKSGAWEERVRGVREELKDIGSELSAEGERVEVDPQRLEATENRLDRLYSLQQKHKVADVPALIALRDEMAVRLDGIQHADQEIDRLRQQAERLGEEASALALRLTETRQKAAPVIEKQVIDICSRLGMPNVRFQVEITPAEELSPKGGDRIVFRFTANKNSAPQPVEKIASGGETSRLMLALKSLTARHKQLPTIIFDEIDTGVSGEIADRMGQILFDLSTHLQVINITHLPQVASKGTTHFRVYKEDTPTATNTRIRRLRPQERIEEIAKMLSGSHITEAAIRQAKSLLG